MKIVVNVLNGHVGR